MTVKKALELSVKAQVIVVEDGSTDNTGKILSAFSNERLHVITRSFPNAKQGKGEALNSAYAFFCNNYENWFPSILPKRLIITVLDADGYLDAHQFEYIAGMFETHQELGGVQVPVTIRNPNTSMLLRMQDLEFVGFSCFVQQARHWFSSLGLGGNGQFVRFSALLKLGDKPWNAALSEDLDIGIRLLLCGEKLGYCNVGFVHQQGLTRIKPFAETAYAMDTRTLSSLEVSTTNLEIEFLSSYQVGFDLIFNSCSLRNDNPVKQRIEYCRLVGVLACKKFIV